MGCSASKEQRLTFFSTSSERPQDNNKNNKNNKNNQQQQQQQGGNSNTNRTNTNNNSPRRNGDTNNHTNRYNSTGAHSPPRNSMNNHHDHQHNQQYSTKPLDYGGNLSKQCQNQQNQGQNHHQQSTLPKTNDSNSNIIGASGTTQSHHHHHHHHRQSHNHGNNSHHHHHHHHHGSGSNHTNGGGPPIPQTPVNNIKPELSYEEILVQKLTSIRKFEQITPNVQMGLLLNSVPLLSSIKQSYKEKLGALMVQETFKRGDYVFRDGDLGDKFYIVVKGQFSLYATSYPSPIPITPMGIGGGMGMGYQLPITPMMASSSFGGNQGSCGGENDKENDLNDQSSGQFGTHHLHPTGLPHTPSFNNGFLGCGLPHTPSFNNGLLGLPHTPSFNNGYLINNASMNSNILFNNASVDSNQHQNNLNNNNNASADSNQHPNNNNNASADSNQSQNSLNSSDQYKNNLNLNNPTLYSSSNHHKNNNNNNPEVRINGGGNGVNGGNGDDNKDDENDGQDLPILIGDTTPQKNHPGKTPITTNHTALPLQPPPTTVALSSSTTPILTLITKFFPSDFFGESALILDLPRQGTVICDDNDSLVLTLQKEHLIDCINALDLTFPHRQIPRNLQNYHQHGQNGQNYHQNHVFMSGNPLLNGQYNHFNPNNSNYGQYGHYNQHQQYSTDIQPSQLFNTPSNNSLNSRNNPHFVQLPAPNNPYPIQTPSTIGNNGSDNGGIGGGSSGASGVGTTGGYDNDGGPNGVNTHKNGNNGNNNSNLGTSTGLLASTPNNHLSSLHPSTQITQSSLLMGQNQPLPANPFIVMENLDQFPIISSENGPKSDDLVANLYAALCKNQLLQALPKQQKIDIINSLTRITITQPHTTLIKQGDTGRHLFIIEKGLCGVFVNNQFVSQLGPFDIFGELSLLHRTPRAATVITSSLSPVLPSLLNDAMGFGGLDGQNLIQNSIQNFPSNFQNSLQNSLLQNLQNQNSFSDDLLNIVNSRNNTTSNNNNNNNNNNSEINNKTEVINEQINNASSSSSVTSAAAVSNDPTKPTLTSAAVSNEPITKLTSSNETMVVLWTINTTKYREICENNYLHNQSLIKHTLGKIPMFNSLSTYERLLLSQNIEIINLPPKSIVFRQNDLAVEGFYILLCGSVDLWRFDETQLNIKAIDGIEEEEETGDGETKTDLVQSMASNQQSLLLLPPKQLQQQQSQSQQQQPQQQHQSTITSLDPSFQPISSCRKRGDIFGEYTYITLLEQLKTHRQQQQQQQNQQQNQQQGKILTPKNKAFSFDRGISGVGGNGGGFGSGNSNNTSTTPNRNPLTPLDHQTYKFNHAQGQGLTIPSMSSSFSSQLLPSSQLPQTSSFDEFLPPRLHPTAVGTTPNGQNELQNGQNGQNGQNIGQNGQNIITTSASSAFITPGPSSSSALSSSSSSVLTTAAATTLSSSTSTSSSTMVTGTTVSPQTPSRSIATIDPPTLTTAPSNLTQIPENSSTIQQRSPDTSPADGQLPMTLSLLSTSLSKQQQQQQQFQQQQQPLSPALPESLSLKAPGKLDLVDLDCSLSGTAVGSNNGAGLGCYSASGYAQSGTLLPTPTSAVSSASASFNNGSITPSNNGSVTPSHLFSQYLTKGTANYTNCSTPTNLYSNFGQNQSYLPQNNLYNLYNPQNNLNNINNIQNNINNKQNNINNQNLQNLNTSFGTNLRLPPSQSTAAASAAAAASLLSPIGNSNSNPIQSNASTSAHASNPQMNVFKNSLENNSSALNKLYQFHSQKDNNGVSNGQNINSNDNNGVSGQNINSSGQSQSHEPMAYGQSSEPSSSGPFGPSRQSPPEQSSSGPFDPSTEQSSGSSGSSGQDIHSKPLNHPHMDHILSQFNSVWYNQDHNTNYYYYASLLKRYNNINDEKNNNANLGSNGKINDQNNNSENLPPLLPRMATAITSNHTTLLRIRVADIVNILHPVTEQLRFKYLPLLASTTATTPTSASSTLPPTPSLYNSTLHTPRHYATTPLLSGSLITNQEHPPTPQSVSQQLQQQQQSSSSSGSPGDQQQQQQQQGQQQTVLTPANSARITQLEEEYKRKMNEKMSSRRMSICSQSISWESLRIIAILGKGAFGFVSLVKDIHTNKTYALKSITKQKIHETKQQEHLLNEKTLLVEVTGHPFIVNLYATARSPTMLHFIFEACLGGDLLTLLRKRRSFTEGQAMFYIGCIILALSYMHDKNILYRDLKPENVVLDAKSGYAKLIDLGFAKRLDNIFTTRTKSICFTLDYLSPEMILRQPYSSSVDIWALGVLLYELVAGYPPFYNMGSSTGDHQRVYEAILHAQIQYPSHFSPYLKELIGAMLIKAPTSRLGCSSTNGIYDIISHPWFTGPAAQINSHSPTGFNWDGLRKLQLKPPFQPSSKVVLKKAPKDLNNPCNDPKNQANITKLIELDQKFNFTGNFGEMYQQDFPDLWTDF